MSEADRYEEFARRMEEKYPKMFSQPYGGFAVGEGWWAIIASLCANIQHYINWKNRESEVVPQVVVTQIKEKFGGLRFYYDGGDDRVTGMVQMAESWADKSCEDCGAPATQKTTGWIKNVCNVHFVERELARKERLGK